MKSFINYLSNFHQRITPAGGGRWWIALIIILLSPTNFLSQTWKPSNTNGTYKNPVIYADYSDPDAICVHDTFYLVSSSFNCVPGLPILQSTDLVNWTIIAHALPFLKPIEFFNKPQHGNGVWAPSIRIHNNEYYIYYGDPDFGIYMLKATNIKGPWSEPILVLAGKGLIDPCPLWDEDGNTYLVHAWAGSRAGIKSILTINKMNPEGTQVIDNGVLIFDGHTNHPTVEGPKLYKRNGYYFIMAPAGGVKTGWQLVLRAKNIYGPYEEKIVLQQGNTSINGPHQGAWVETTKGESWFLHFQDAEAFGRIVHLQPITWKNDWPIMGMDSNNDGIGEPVSTYKKPIFDKTITSNNPQTSDEFNSPQLGLQWQWHANPQLNWGGPTSFGFLRLNAVQIPDSAANLWDVTNLLLQKFPAPQFTVTTKINFTARTSGEKVGLLIMGEDYAYLALDYKNGEYVLVQNTCKNASKKTVEISNENLKIANGNIFLQVAVNQNAECIFRYSTDGINFTNLGLSFTAKPGRWIGSKVGLFCIRSQKTNDAGTADIDWFRIE